MASTLTAPPFDPELEVVLANFPTGGPLTYESILQRRKFTTAQSDPKTVLSDPEILAEEKSFTGLDGNTIELTVLRLKTSAGGQRPCIYNIHGGGMVMGTRYFLLGKLFDLIKKYDVVVISVEYRLAPEHKAPAQVEDSYAGLKWAVENAHELGIDTSNVIVHGGSSGAGLAAGVVLMARDLKGPAVLAQCLLYPMLDDRQTTLSTAQFQKNGTWTGDLNLAAWDHMVPNRGMDDVSIYVAPARATDLFGLPKTFIEVGSAEPFRDEDIAYAMKLWEHGIDAELHVWPGLLHGYDVFGGHVKIVKDATEARLNWYQRLLSTEKHATP